MPNATSGYEGNTLKNQVQGVSGYAPSNLSMVGDYFKRFQPDTRMPMQTVGQQYRAFAPQASKPHAESRPAPQAMQQAPEPRGKQVPILGRSGTVLGYGWADPGDPAFERGAQTFGM